VVSATPPLRRATSWRGFRARHGLGRALAWAGRALWQPPAAPARRVHVYADLVSLVAAVCAAIVLTKVVLAALDLADPARPPLIYDDDWLGTLGRVVACCAEDLAAGLGCLLLAAGALRLGLASLYRASVRTAAYLAALAALLLTVVDAHLFHQLRRFLTLDLFEAGGGLHMETSVEQYAASPAFKATAVLLPLVTLAVHLGQRQALGRLWRRAAGWLCRPAVPLVLSAGLLLGADAARGELFADGAADFAQNPQLLLVRSLFAESAVDEFAGADVAEDEPEPWPAALVDDFRPGRPRPSGVVRRPPHNLIVIAAESLGADYLELYGAPFPNTPNLCRLRDKGVVFTNFYATATKTICSALPLFGSLYNDVRARQGTAFEYEGFPVPAASRWLGRHGYKTYFLTANGEGWDVFMNLDETFTAPGTFDVGRDEKHPFWSRGGLDPARIHAKDGYMDRAAFDDARRALRDARGHKFYLMIWNYETHYPYYPGAGPHFDRRLFPPSLAKLPDRQDDFDAYLQSIWRLDKLIGELYRDLEKLGLADDTLVVLTGDHGEAWGQHGTWIHGHSVYQEEVHVPLVLLCPRLAHLGPRQEVVGDHVALWPTITDVLGLPADPRWQGRSLLGAAPGEARRAYFNNHGSTMLGVREGRYKYVEDLRRKRSLLFDLARDPGERHDLSEAHPARCDRLRERLQAWVQYQSRLTRRRLSEAQRGPAR
jgi:arylsulfatase A-like enzyme